MAMLDPQTSWRPKEILKKEYTKKNYWVDDHALQYPESKKSLDPT